QKAAAAGKRSLATPIAIAPIAEKLARALTKVYAERQVVLETDVAAELRAAVDEGDLTELLGNLMDNAAKYGGGYVHTRAESTGDGLRLMGDDNGPGFPEDVRNQLFKRGVRADTTREGQGLGLAMVADIVHSYTGKITLQSSESGGARVVVV